MPSPSPTLRSPVWRDLALVLLVALAPRAAWLATNEVVVAEGTEYARLAENLLAGAGYRGTLDGEQRMFAPGYPVAIAGVSYVLGIDAPLAAELLSLISGLGLVALLYRLGWALGGRRVALAVGLLAALLPGLVLMSASAFNEGTQLVCLIAGVFVLLPIARGDAVRPWGAGWRAGLAGLCFGAGVLIRVESLPLAVLAAILLVLAPERRGARRRLFPALLLLLVVGLCALPYTLYVHRVTGGFGLHAKGDRVLVCTERFARGQAFARANYEIDADGEDVGPWLRPNQDWSGDSPAEIWSRSRTAIARRTARGLLESVATYASGHTMGSLLYVLLAIPALGVLLRRPDGRFLALWLLGAVASGFMMMATYKPVLRYLASTAPASVVLGGVGLVAWEARRRRPFRAWAFGALIVVLVVSASRGFVTGLREYAEPRGEPNVAMRAAGEWLRPRLGDEQVMAIDPRVAYYSGARWHPLPWSETRAALEQRIDDENIRFLCLRRSEDRQKARPGPWFDPEAAPWPMVWQRAQVVIYRVR